MVLFELGPDICLVRPPLTLVGHPGISEYLSKVFIDRVVMSADDPLPSLKFSLPASDTTGTGDMASFAGDRISCYLPTASDLSPDVIATE